MAIINSDAILAAVEAAWAQEVTDIDAAFTLAIEEDLYKYDRVTVRSTGEIAGSPRNIVDTGALRDSQSYRPMGTTTGEFEWDVDYAADVHTGIRAEGGLMPARPWTEYAIKGGVEAPIEYQRADAILDVVEDFAAKFKQELGN